jgi:hypothetical protein
LAINAIKFRSALQTLSLNYVERSSDSSLNARFHPFSSQSGLRRILASKWGVCTAAMVSVRHSTDTLRRWMRFGPISSQLWCARAIDEPRQVVPGSVGVKPKLGSCLLCRIHDAGSDGKGTKGDRRCNGKTGRRQIIESLRQKFRHGCPPVERSRA